MLKGPLSESNYKPKFGGHETFPIRYGWLTKFVGLLNEPKEEREKILSSVPDTMSYLGVGKNMVQSMRHWAMTTGVTELDASDSEKVSDFGNWLLNASIHDKRKGGLDPFMENTATLWALHWRIAGLPSVVKGKHKSTAWFWIFSHYPSSSFRKEDLEDGLARAIQDQSWPAVSRNTIKRDIECLVRSYCFNLGRVGQLSEDSIECPLSELSLVRPSSNDKTFEFIVGDKAHLSDHVLNFAVAEFIEASSETKTVSLDQLSHAPGSPGRVFKLDEMSLSRRLENISETSRGMFEWIETAGMMQILVRRKPVPLSLLRKAYAPSELRKAA